jgi:YesN/AraC family two-component response regulator
LLDFVVPKLSGADVLINQMHADADLRQVPVIVLSNKVLSLDDVKHIESHTRFVLQSKGIWLEKETVTALNRAMFSEDTLSAHTSALAKQMIAYLHENYTRPISKWEIAEAVGVREDYLSRVFHKVTGVSPQGFRETDTN